MSEVKSILKSIDDLQKKGDALLAEKKAKIASVQKGNYMTIGNKSNSFESNILRAFGAKNAAELVKTNTMLPKFNHVKDEYKQYVKSLKSDVDVARYVAQIFHGASTDRIGADQKNADYIASIKSIGSSYFAKHELIPKLKSFGSTLTAAGDEWVPTLISENYIEEYQLEQLLESRFPSMTMASNPYEMPVQDSLTKARIISESALMTASNFATSKLTFNATKFGEYNILPEELTEDSAPDILAAARLAVISAQSRAIESAIINGDNDGTHIDSDTQALGADVAEKAFKGLRRQALGNSANGSTLDFGNAAITEANLRTLRGRMKRFGVNAKELLILVGPVAYQQMLSLPSVATVEKFGPMATVLNGALTAYQGIPIVVSEFMRENLNATGVYDGTTVNRAGIVMLNTRRWWVGVRRPIMVKAMNDLPGYDRFLLASYQRKAFEGIPQGADETSVVYGFNVAV